MKNRLMVNLAIGCFLVVVAVLGYINPANQASIWTGGGALAEDFCDHEAGRYVTVVSPQGSVITMTSRQVFPGDEIITARAEHYRVTGVDKDIAEAELLGLDRELMAWSDYFGRYGDDLTVPVQADREFDVALYHSHTMESYVPDSGEAFSDHGDIIDVGRALAGHLRRQGLRVFHDTTIHNPHDAMAYQRSRQTALQLLEERRPAALIDVHRDGVPDPDFYRRVVDGREISQVRLVIGRQNPKKDANLDFARRLMARANERNPEVVKEIFSASGNYNQDLLSSAILIEAGTHTNTQAEAEGGVGLLAEAVPVVLGVGPAGPEAAGGAAAWRVVFWVILAVLVGLGTYLVISAGGVPQARDKLVRFWRHEFSELLKGKPLKLKEKPDDRDKPEP
ncbi:MAG: stage II sporulation protein P [Candidatus Desulforudis sp.]|nr:stage II sporulation protein P [Desulforudis sp.]